MATTLPGDARVLVGVLKRKRDLDLLRQERWYRMPAARAPRQTFAYLAFYEPARFGPTGKRIRSYARVLAREIRMRRDLVPNEPNHPAAGEPYVRFRVGPLQKLPRPIVNVPPRRVSFGFATFRDLRRARNILELYRVAPTEQMMERGLRRAGIRLLPQYRVSCGGKRYCLDFAILCRRGRIAIECDNRKAHVSPRQQARDAAKDDALHRHGWRVIRLTEHEVVHNITRALSCVRRAAHALGGAALEK